MLASQASALGSPLTGQLVSENLKCLTQPLPTQRGLLGHEAHQVGKAHAPHSLLKLSDVPWKHEGFQVPCAQSIFLALEVSDSLKLQGVLEHLEDALRLLFEASLTWICFDSPPEPLAPFRGPTEAPDAPVRPLPSRESPPAAACPASRTSRGAAGGSNHTADRVDLDISKGQPAEPHLPSAA